MYNGCPTVKRIGLFFRLGLLFDLIPDQTYGRRQTAKWARVSPGLRARVRGVLVSDGVLVRSTPLL